VNNSTGGALPDNLPLDKMLEDRHTIANGADKFPPSQRVGYHSLVYISKFHFRDVGIISQIEAKVVNRSKGTAASSRPDESGDIHTPGRTAGRRMSSQRRMHAPPIVVEHCRKIEDRSVRCAVQTPKPRTVLESQQHHAHSRKPVYLGKWSRRMRQKSPQVDQKRT